MKLITPENLLESIRCGDGIDITGSIQLLFNKEHFYDDTLDVSALFPHALPEACVVSFKNIHPTIKLACMAYARAMIFYGSAASTAQHKIDALNILFNELDNLGINNITLNTLSMDEIEAVTNKSDISEERCYRICIAVSSILSIFKSLYKNEDFAMDMKALALLRTAHGKILRKGMSGNKTPDIDEDFFDILNDRLPGIIWDETIPYNYRLVAAAVHLQMWVGLRRSELFLLTKDAMYTKVSTTGRVFTFLKYGVPKLSHGGRTAKYADTYMLPAARNAFNALLDINKLNPRSKNSNRLIIFDTDTQCMNSYYSYYVERLFSHYLAEISKDQKWEFVKKHIVNKEVVYYPTVTQYRVHLCSFLYHQGVGHHIIELGMSHLTSQMTTYYCRVADKTFKKEKELVDRKIRTSINNDFDIIPHAELGEKLLNQLIMMRSKMFVYESKFHKMIEQGDSYLYEVTRYAAKLKILIDSELIPTIDYLEKRNATVGKDAVLEAHPSLRLINDIEELKNYITKCRNTLTPYLKNSEDIPKLTRLK